MRRPSIVLLAACLSLAGGWAQAQAQTRPPAAAKPAKALIILDAKAFDPAMVLGEPPQPGSGAEQAELAALENIQKARTAERFAQAQWDDAHEDIDIFTAAIGAPFDLKALPRTAELLAVVDNDQAILASTAKTYFKRPRPYLVDPTLVGCDHEGTKPLTSYPSGHATLGYSLGAVLEALIPARAAAIRARADDYAYSRMVCGVHYRSDVEASRRLGLWVARAMLASPALKPRLDAARAELKAAGLGG